MRVRDEAQWSQSQQWFGVNEDRKAFRDYLEFWAEQAEVLVDHGIPPLQALQETLSQAEEAIGNAQDPNALGQIIVFMVGLWQYGDEAVADMTPLELAVLSAATRVHIEELQKLAQAEGDAIDSDHGAEGLPPTDS